MSTLFSSVFSAVRNLFSGTKVLYPEVTECKDGQQRILSKKESRTFAKSLAEALMMQKAVFEATVYSDYADYDPYEDSVNYFSSECRMSLVWDFSLSYTTYGISGIKLTHKDRIHDGSCLSGEEKNTLEPVLAADDRLEVSGNFGTVSITCGEFDRLLSLCNLRLRFTACRLAEFTEIDGYLLHLKRCFYEERKFSALCEHPVNQCAFSGKYRRVNEEFFGKKEEVLASFIAEALRLGNAEVSTAPAEDPQFALQAENSVRFCVTMKFPDHANDLGVSELTLTHVNLAHDGCKLFKPAVLGCFVHDQIDEDSIITFKYGEDDFVLLHSELMELFSEYDQDIRLLFQDYASLCEKQSLETMLKVVDYMIFGTSLEHDAEDDAVRSSDLACNKQEETMASGSVSKCADNASKRPCLCNAHVYDWVDHLFWHEDDRYSVYCKEIIYD